MVVDYDLCPAITITQISENARTAPDYIWLNADNLVVNRDRVTGMAHSAVRHINRMMMAADWPARAADLIKAEIPVSPLSYLEPVRLTEALNEGIRMDAAEAHAQSPMIHHPPATNVPQLVVVGCAKTARFSRASSTKSRASTGKP